MKQFLLSDKAVEGNKQQLIGRDFHYLCHVLRKKEGDCLNACDPEGNKCLITINKINSDFCTIKISKLKTIETDCLQIELFICLPKGKKLDQIIRQATEVGVSRIHPLYSRYSLVKFNNTKDINSKKERWEKIIKEARQQSGSPVETAIETPIPLSELIIKASNDELFLFMHQDKIEENGKIHQNQYKKISYLIGPEGGLSDNEVSFLQTAGAVPVFFGDNVLRTETASLYGAAYIKSVFQENYKWSNPL